MIMRVIETSEVGEAVSRVGEYIVALIVCILSSCHADSPSGNATHRTGLSRIHSCFNVFSERLPTTDDLVRAGCSGPQMRCVMYSNARRTELIGQTQNKHGLSEFEQPRLVGDIL